MLEQAIKKIRNEMDQNRDNQYIQVIGGFLINHLNQNQDTAEKMLTDGKTIDGSLKQMQVEAKKIARNNMAMISDQQAYQIVLKYFGIDVQPQEYIPQYMAATSALPPDQPVLTNMINQSVKGMSFGLDDLD